MFVAEARQLAEFGVGGSRLSNNHRQPPRAQQSKSSYDGRERGGSVAWRGKSDQRVGINS